MRLTITTENKNDDADNDLNNAVMITMLTDGNSAHADAEERKIPLRYFTVAKAQRDWTVFNLGFDW